MRRRSKFWDARRIQALQADVALLRSQNQKSEAVVADLKLRVQQAQARRYANGLIYALVGDVGDPGCRGLFLEPQPKAGAGAAVVGRARGCRRLRRGFVRTGRGARPGVIGVGRWARRRGRYRSGGGPGSMRSAECLPRARDWACWTVAIFRPA